MPDPTFRGNPYQLLDVPADASNAAIKRRWRELAREHHPDRAAGDSEEAARLTRRMARINAAYDLLRDSSRRARFDSSVAGRRAREEQGSRAGDGFDNFDGYGADTSASGGPPPPPPTSPVTARYDTTASFRPHNTRLHAPARTMRGQVPPDRRDYESERDLRASTPTGPVERRRGRRLEPPPTLREARETTLSFGRFHGYTLGEVELLEPTYLDWIARTITRDRDLVQKARVIQTDLDERGVDRRSRPAAAGSGNQAAAG